MGARAGDASPFRSAAKVVGRGWNTTCIPHPWGMAEEIAMNQIGLAAVVMAVAGATAHAQFIETHSVTFSFDPALVAPGFPDATVQLPKFSTQGGTRTLQLIELDLTSTISANVTGENDSQSTVITITLDLIGSVQAMGPSSLSAFANMTQTVASPPGSLGPSDGVPGSGPDFYNFGSVAGSGNGGGVLFSPPTFTPYLYAGGPTQFVDFDIFASAAYQLGGVGNATLVVSDLLANGEVTIRYTYIPAPGAAALFALGGLAAFRRRR